MSHLKERREKNCLNCNAQLQGRYCHICGQENIESKETVWHLVSHFFQDITHFDGKFFSTLKLLVFRPGFLAMEYMTGRRASYLNPVRMYVFSSAFFFLIFFSFLSMDGEKSTIHDINGKTLPEIAKMDSATFADFTRDINREDNRPDKPMTKAEFKRYTDTVLKRAEPVITENKFKTRAGYDSALASGIVKDNWFVRAIRRKAIDIGVKYNNDSRRITVAFISTLIHSLPQILFISLPMLALLLNLLYARRKGYYYVNHAIFSIQLYIFVFIALLFGLSFAKLNEQLHWGFISFLRVLLYLSLFFYEYKAMRNFYQQGRAMTIFKYVLLNIMFLIVMVVIFSFFVLFSFYKI